MIKTMSESEAFYRRQTVRLRGAMEVIADQLDLIDDDIIRSLAQALWSALEKSGQEIHEHEGPISTPDSSDT